MRQGNELNYSGQPIYIGIDVHKHQWTVSVSTAHVVNAAVTIPAPFAQQLRKYLEKHYPMGRYYAAYESGFNGYWPLREDPPGKCPVTQIVNLKQLGSHPAG